jgi:hypothetical protein
MMEARVSDVVPANGGGKKSAGSYDRSETSFERPGFCSVPVQRLGTRSSGHAGHHQKGLRQERLDSENHQHHHMYNRRNSYYFVGFSCVQPIHSKTKAGTGVHWRSQFTASAGRTEARRQISREMFRNSQNRMGYPIARDS